MQFEQGIDLRDRVDTVGHIAVEVDDPEFARVTTHLFAMGAGSTMLEVRLRPDELDELAGVYREAARRLRGEPPVNFVTFAWEFEEKREDERGAA